MDMVAILVAVAGLVVGMIIGGFIGASLSKSAKETKGLRSDLDQAHDELSAYKDQVKQHFSRTSELVNDMTSSYRAVHEHLASSSQKLCDGSVKSLDMETPELLASSNSKEELELKEAKENPVVKAQAASETEVIDKNRVVDDVVVAKEALKKKAPEVYH